MKNKKLHHKRGNFTRKYFAPSNLHQFYCAHYMIRPKSHVKEVPSISITPKTKNKKQASFKVQGTSLQRFKCALTLSERSFRWQKFSPLETEQRFESGKVGNRFCIYLESIKKNLPAKKSISQFKFITAICQLVRSCSVCDLAWVQ